ncbi:MAG: hypothetical protein WAM28_06870 [Chlamydiales bacterium]
MSEEKLLHLLRKKKGFFEAILELTESEEKLPLNDWVTVLEQKKILLSCVEEIDKELLPFKEMMHELSQEIVEELETIRKIVQQILDISDFNHDQRKNMFKMT